MVHLVTTGLWKANLIFIDRCGKALVENKSVVCVCVCVTSLQFVTHVTDIFSKWQTIALFGRRLWPEENIAIWTAALLLLGSSVIQSCTAWYIHTAIHTYMRTYIHTLMHTYIHAYIHTYYTYIHTYVYTYIHASMHTYIIYTYIRIYIHTCKHVYIYIYINT